MFTLQQKGLEALSGLMPDDAIATLRQLFCNCNQALEHRGPITLKYAPATAAARASADNGDLGEGGYALYIPPDIRIGLAGRIINIGGEIWAAGWATATGDWEANGGDPRVSCQDDIRGGGAAVGENFWVYLPVPSGEDPAVFDGDTIAYFVDDAGNKVAPGYGNGKIGDIKLWCKTAATIPAGWRECDASATVDMRGRFVAGRDPTNLAYSGVGTAGGYTYHGTTENNHSDHVTTSDYVFDTLQGTHPSASQMIYVDDNTTIPPSVHNHGFSVDVGEYLNAMTLSTHTNTDNRPPYKTVIFIERYK